MKRLLILSAVFAIVSGCGQSVPKTIQEPVIPVATAATPTISAVPATNTLTSTPVTAPAPVTAPPSSPAPAVIQTVDTTTPQQQSTEIKVKKEVIAEKPQQVVTPKVKPVPAASNVYYNNCTEARKAGKTPIRRGEPGYSSKLDRDHDGVACE